MLADSIDFDAFAKPIQKAMGQKKQDRFRGYRSARNLHDVCAIGRGGFAAMHRCE